MKIGTVTVPPRRSGVPAAVLALALAAAPATLGAQALRGVLTDAATGRALGDATVVLLDEGGRQRAATLARSDGAYALVAPAPGRYRVRVQRVGYRGAVGGPVTLLAGATLVHDVRVTPVPVSLAAVRATGRQRCVGAAHAGGEAAAVWEQVRAALEATRLTARERRVRVTVRDTRAEYAPGARRPHQVAGTERTGVTDVPYRAPAPERLARDGYVVREGDAYWFYAPDAAALLSDAFAESYCVRLAGAAPPAPGLVGLAFEPSSHRAPGVRGVLWLDARSAELRSLDFEYVALPQPVADAARGLPAGTFGGRVEFAALPSAGGAWVVRRWSVRAPVLAARRAAALAPLGRLPGGGGLPGELASVAAPPPARGGPSLVVTAVREEGGEVIAAADAAGRTLWSARWGAATGVVLEGGTGRALPGASVVVLGGSDDTGSDPRAAAATTDADGRWLVGGLAPGFHTLMARDPRDTSAFAFAVVDVPAADTARIDLLLVAALGPTLAAAQPRGDAASCATLRAAADRVVDSLLAIPAAGWRVEDAGGTTGSDAREAVRQAQAVVQAAVDTTGRLEMATFRVLRSESPALGDAARLVAAEMRVPPSEPAPGCPVRQVLTVPMRLRLDR